MNNTRLDKILRFIADQIEGPKGNWHFVVQDIQFICLTDELHNRMRIISPIIEHKDMSKDDYYRCMKANFHSAIDVKYAVSGKVLWAVFMHPLKELTTPQVEDAIQQVFTAVKTYGTSYSSLNLYFPTDEDRKRYLN